ncbi:MAG: DoxX family protein [Pseudomonadota bacterium]
MSRLVSTYLNAARGLDRLGDALFPTLARLLFVAVLFGYYWNSAKTKLGDGFFGFLAPSDGAYIQIFPRVVEAAGYDFSALGVFHWAVVVAGTWAEFLLPVLIAIGLATRFAALGMIGFIFVQSWVDVVGHGLGETDVGGWFDRLPSALILDQRAFWVFALLVLVIRGAGPISADWLIARSGFWARQDDPLPAQG